MHGEVATLHLQVQPATDQNVDAAQADRVAQTVGQNPEEIAVLRRIIVTAIAPETRFRAAPAEEELRELPHVIHLAIMLRTLRQCIQPAAKLILARLPSAKEGRQLRQCLLQLCMRRRQPTPRQPRGLQFLTANRIEYLRDQPLLIFIQRFPQRQQRLRKLPPHGCQLGPHRIPDHRRFVVQKLEQRPQIRAGSRHELNF